ncbi:MAG: formate--tetrahydrofolate ligase [Nitrospira sp.]|nr:formate--tetrahydrofolate ligase [Nitrospira sp.]
MVDNHLFHGNALKLDPQGIRWPRTLGVRDCALREVVIGTGLDRRSEQFVITEASEVMQCWHWRGCRVLWDPTDTGFAEKACGRTS